MLTPVGNREVSNGCTLVLTRISGTAAFCTCSLLPFMMLEVSGEECWAESKSSQSCMLPTGCATNRLQSP